MSFYVKLARDAYESQLKREGYNVIFFDVCGSQAYFLWDNEQQIVVFRGTDELRDLWYLSKSHQGFMDYAFMLTRIPIDYKKRLVLVGHSLGGAVAVCFADICQHTDIEIHSFGCPRVGSKSFVEGTKQIPHFRYTTRYDHVPQFPLFNYHHGKEIKLNSPFSILFNNHQVNFYVKMVEKFNSQKGNKS